MKGTLRYIFIIPFIFLTITSAGVHSAAAEYIVVPHEDNRDLVDMGVMDTSGADANVNFWDLPLWIQISFIAGIFAAGLEIFKAIPVILGRIKDPLENEIRQEIFEYISENPGCTITDISDCLNLNRNSAKYHVRMLKSHKSVYLDKTEKSHRFFKSSAAFDESRRTAISLLKNETRKMLLKSILEDPGITNGELAAKHRMNKSTIHWYINKFQKKGVINCIPKGRHRRYYLNSSFKSSIKGVLDNKKV